MNESTYIGYNVPNEEFEAFMADRRAGIERAIRSAEEEEEAKE